ncbi:DUF2017 family protein [Agreia sp. PsM10]|uniref:DUF2017 family protein n=1 Tax=Agreia sp. PsM10 TaxID=3030533 RepID=UPI00263B2CB5|nr:DUF2017 family protein [Agreia sp. PsM10]MDN4638761.1 DUF2017 family protein [Agreia sp. PsM10]
MTPFVRQGDLIGASFERAEAEILVTLATDVHSLLADADTLDPDSQSSRALDRLLPAAYGDGAENDAEFRRFTSEGLVERKVHNAELLVEAFGERDEWAGAVRVNLDAAAASAWLRSLTDIRLTIAAGLGIEHDGDELLIDTDDRFVLEVYGWVGFVQESLLRALDPDFS